MYKFTWADEKLYRNYSRNDELRRNKGRNVEIDSLSITFCSFAKGIFISRVFCPQAKKCPLSNLVTHFSSSRVSLVLQPLHKIHWQSLFLKSSLASRDCTVCFFPVQQHWHSFLKQQVHCACIA